jgi:hypothetical protein
MQQGCKYLHEMPDKKTREAIGLRHLPQWWVQDQSRKTHTNLKSDRLAALRDSIQPPQSSDDSEAEDASSTEVERHPVKKPADYTSLAHSMSKPRSGTDPGFFEYMKQATVSASAAGELMDRLDRSTVSSIHPSAAPTRPNTAASSYSTNVQAEEKTQRILGFKTIPGLKTKQTTTSGIQRSRFADAFTNRPATLADLPTPPANAQGHSKTASSEIDLMDLEDEPSPIQTHSVLSPSLPSPRPATSHQAPIITEDLIAAARREHDRDPSSQFYYAYGHKPKHLRIESATNTGDKFDPDPKDSSTPRPPASGRSKQQSSAAAAPSMSRPEPMAKPLTGLKSSRFAEPEDQTVPVRSTQAYGRLGPSMAVPRSGPNRDSTAAVAAAKRRKQRAAAVEGRAGDGR